ncbi:glycosyl transferase [Cellulomonas terrae]|uniref:Glycosyl transferase n=2 Tax=Cellulomonas terrae TaxID=311234 RepID=A0A511JI33_9CELL|nr:glycosyl transferase [Cellulomonas terrae]
MLAYGAEPYLEEAVRAVLASTGVELELVLVDNGATGRSVDAVRALADPRVRVLTPSHNLGFTGGVDLGVRGTTAPVVALVNSDAIVQPDALVELARALDDPGVGLVSGLVRLAATPDLVNTVGNPVHLLGLSWAGHMGEPVAEHTEPTTVASVTGATMAVRRSVWDALGGFPDEYFAYLEDLELSWRAWQRGLRVCFVPTAVSDHHYEFSRSPLKMYLVDRNRLAFVLTCYGTRTLVLLALPLLAFDVALLAVAVAQGWGRQWWRARWWVLGHVGWLRARRRDVQAARVVGDRDLAPLWTDSFDAAQLPLPPGGAVIEKVLQAYWRVARRLL